MLNNKSKKQMLIELMNSHKLKYPELLQKAEANTASVSWGMGGGDPYSLEPYRMELMGAKPGRMLKKELKPARNRFRYAFDQYGNVIHNLEYTFLGGPPGDQEWCHSDEFYEWHKDYVIRYFFGSGPRDGVVPPLSQVFLVEIVNSQVVKVYQLYSRDHIYNEWDYDYENGVLKRITLTWPDNNLFPQREFVIIQEPVGISIWETGDKGMELIYREKKAKQKKKSDKQP